MMRFMWDSKYSVNIKSIDKQHQTFFEIINEFYNDFGEGEGTQEQLKNIVERMAEYGESHLGYEEKYFRELKYPQAKDHIKQHNTFRKQVANYQAKLKGPVKNVSGMACEMAEYAKSWLGEHILETDQKYAEFFLMHDVK